MQRSVARGTMWGLVIEGLAVVVWEVCRALGTVISRVLFGRL